MLNVFRNISLVKLSHASLAETCGYFKNNSHNSFFSLILFVVFFFGRMIGLTFNVSSKVIVESFLGFKLFINACNGLHFFTLRSNSKMLAIKAHYISLESSSANRLTSKTALCILTLRAMLLSSFKAEIASLVALD